MMSIRRNRRRGQGMTEYIIIVALIAIAAIGVVGLFGDDIRHLFAASSNALAGEEDARHKAQTAHDRHYKHKDLSKFATDNQGAI